MSIEKGYTSEGAETAASALTQAMSLILPSMPMRKRKLRHQASSIPKTSLASMRRSCHDIPIQIDQLSELSSHEDETVLYLGYGSNLAAETFLGKRGIKPLSQVNIVAPSIALTFDLPGLPYAEPCFANTRYRPSPHDPPEADRPPYHKNAWKKGLVGVVYEVTKRDYAHIIATEGGGSGYHDVLVECYELNDDPDVEVPLEPPGTPFRAHTLYAHSAEPLRPNPDYAQPSPRYLKLITDGAREHNLPKEYRHFLSNIRTYHTTTTKQQLGGFVFLAVWGPIFGFFFGGAARIFLRKDGTYPEWFAKFTVAVFAACWASYDGMFFKLFGDGERTIGDELDHGQEGSWTGDKNVPQNLSEKTPLLVEEGARIANQV
ncbi:hypothetical protein LTR70_009741 [Exophiala xenobiotica]|uniref:gamma-glutamylcyclotransferase n=1 Tax=Lithohypha guttulata TaxID=1690604 RepID=A0ABR0JY16_9EURO|nr:hypothetical protein LTR24_009621 [Lithohypha guttulata]KAK5310088.1 hypothetical protein LTR70_009741 [Exophiala xenobiotica]